MSRRSSPGRPRTSTVARDRTQSVGRPAAATHLGGCRLLFLNWRDRTHPRAGGAEVYCHELAARLSRAGASVTLFTAAHPSAPAQSDDRGVTIRRRGGRFGVYGRAALHLLRMRLAGRPYDAVVDFQNGVPFFAPLAAGRTVPVVLVVHHVHQQQFEMHFPWPLSAVGRWLEAPASRAVYRSTPTVVVSPSTRDAVRRRLGLAGPVTVIPNGSASGDRPPERDGDRSARSQLPTIVSVSRLVPQKRLHLLLDAVPAVRRDWPGLRVEIAGSGPERGLLERHARHLGIADVVRCHGYVSDQRRRQLFASGWITVAPSIREGWGLAVVDANATGLPAVVYDVPGLRDAVIPGVTGWILDRDEPLAAGISAALAAVADPADARRWAARCRAWAASFSWDASAGRLAALLRTEMNRIARGMPDRRSARDAATVVDVPLDDTTHHVRGGCEPSRRSPRPLSAAVARRVRATDELAVGDGRLRLLLRHCDLPGARRVLGRLGVGPGATVRAADPVDRLLGARRLTAGVP